MIFVKRLQRYQRSKLEVEKNICQLGWPRVHGFEPGRSADIFSELQLWLMVTLQPLDKNGCIVPYLKDLFYICLETKVQGFWITFEICNLGSKYPYFNRAYVVSSGFGCTHLYGKQVVWKHPSFKWGGFQMKIVGASGPRMQISIDHSWWAWFQLHLFYLQWRSYKFQKGPSDDISH